MSMTIHDLMEKPKNRNYDNVVFRRIIEDHLDILRSPMFCDMVAVDPQIAYRCNGDFNLLMKMLGYDIDLWWLYLRVNGYHSPSEYRDHITNLLIPHQTYIETLLSKFINMSTIK